MRDPDGRMKGSLPANLEEIILLAAKSESMYVVFPWSTWPLAVMFLVKDAFWLIGG